MRVKGLLKIVRLFCKKKEQGFFLDIISIPLDYEKALSVAKKNTMLNVLS